MIAESDLTQRLQMFVTNSGLPPEPTWTNLTLDAAAGTIPAMLEVIKSATGRTSSIVPVHNYSHPSADELGALFTRHGSDKCDHNYHHLYASILGPRRYDTLAILEIGLGTNNEDVVSNMGAGARPGASLRAWRDYLPKSSIFGADVDRRVLFTEDRIQTFYVDQTQSHTFDAMGMPTLDMIIDDGLHSPHANFVTLAWALGKVRAGGWVVIEDIRGSTLPAWHLTALALPSARYASQIVSWQHGYLFVVEKLAWVAGNTMSASPVM
jgi:hypothetical protein